MTQDLRKLAEQAIELSEKATAGPWVWRQLGEHESLFADHGRRDVIACDMRTRNDRGVLVRAKAGMKNPDFIAFSRTALPALAKAYLALQSSEPSDADFMRLHIETLEAKLAKAMAVVEAASKMFDYCIESESPGSTRFDSVPVERLSQALAEISDGKETK